MKLLVLFALTIVPAYGHHILCMQTMPMRSHSIMMRAIVDVLLGAGHEVTFITTYPDTTHVKNLKQIDISEVSKIIEDINLADRNTMKAIEITDVSRNISRMVVTSPGVREAVVNGRFDAVITEHFHSDLEAGYAAVLQIPWVVLTSTLEPYMEYLVDTVRSIPTVPIVISDAPIPMNFIQRLQNTRKYLQATYKNWLELSKTKIDYENYFGPLAKARSVYLPPFGDAIHNISVLFVNSHPSIAPVKSLPPNVVDIAGYHIGDIPSLPKDLQNLLDFSKQGVIYFSMGSALKSARFPDKTKNELLQLFGSLPYTVLWKFESNLENLPANVHVRNWIPQSSVLAHPNVKLFITHGGRLSTLEALQNGLPTVVIPVFGDQLINAARSVEEGLAIRVDFSSNMAQGIGSALKTMFSDDRYHKRAQTLSALFRNRPVSPSKLIQHYVELAIQSKGALHLRSTSHLYSWLELWMLDQAAALLLIIYILYAVVRIIIYNIISSVNGVKKPKKNISPRTNPKNKSIKKH